MGAPAAATALPALVRFGQHSFAPQGITCAALGMSGRARSTSHRVFVRPNAPVPLEALSAYFARFGSVTDVYAPKSAARLVVFVSYLAPEAVEHVMSTPVHIVAGEPAVLRARKLSSQSRLAASGSGSAGRSPRAALLRRYGRALVVPAVAFGWRPAAAASLAACGRAQAEASSEGSVAVLILARPGPFGSSHRPRARNITRAWLPGAATLEPRPWARARHCFASLAGDFIFKQPPGSLVAP